MHARRQLLRGHRGTPPLILGHSYHHQVLPLHVAHLSKDRVGCTAVLDLVRLSAGELCRAQQLSSSSAGQWAMVIKRR